MIERKNKDSIFRYPADRVLTDAKLQAFIDKNDQLVTNRYRPLLQAYENDYKIFHQAAKPKFKPDNRIAVNFAQYITDTFEGFFMGVPARVSATIPAVQEYLARFEAYSGADDHNAECRTMTRESHPMVFGRNGLPPCVVGNNTESRTVCPHTHYPGMTLIQMRTAIDTVGWSVNIPQTYGSPITSQWSCNLPCTIEIHLAVDLNGSDALAVAQGKLRPQFPLSRQFIDGFRLMLEYRRRLMLRGIIMRRIEDRHAIVRNKGSLRHCHYGNGEAAHQHDDSIRHISLKTI